MKIAIVGAGISGLVAAHRLHRRHRVTLLEADARPGGHAYTVEVDDPAGPVALDLGFLVFNRDFYPGFTALLDELGVASQPAPMSLSVRCDRTGLEYGGASANGLFAQRRNLIRRRFQRMLSDIWRFNRLAPRFLAEPDEGLDVRGFARRHGLGEGFMHDYLLPLGSALWSSPPVRFGEFPMRFVAEFLHNHGMLRIRRRPQWRTVAGGSRHYVEALAQRLGPALRLGCAVTRVDRDASGMVVTYGDGKAERFDHVIFACHADQALKLLDQPTETERELLGQFPYQSNDITLHTDTRVLPRSRRAWASWNFRRLPGDASEQAPVQVTYNLNLLQSLRAERTYCVTLNDRGDIDARHVIRRLRWDHPQYTPGWAAARRRRAELINRHRSSYCGAYWGFGFHEDGLQSGLDVARALEQAA